MTEQDKPLLYTSYFARLRRIDLTKFYDFSICASPPKFYCGLNFIMLTPSRELVMAYKYQTGMSEEQYEQEYRRSTLGHLCQGEIIDRIFNVIPPKKTPVMLCYEKVGDFCHRHILARWLTEGGYPCQEMPEELLLPKGGGA